MVEESVMMTLKDKADFSSFKPRPFNMREFYDRAGHDIKEMLLSCYFRGAECSAEDFTVVSMNTISVSGVLKDKIRSVETGMMGILCFVGTLHFVLHVTYWCTKCFNVNMFQKKVDLSSVGHVLSSYSHTEASIAAW